MGLPVQNDCPRSVLPAIGRSLLWRLVNSWVRLASRRLVVGPSESELLLMEIKADAVLGVACRSDSDVRDEGRRAARQDGDLALAVALDECGCGQERSRSCRSGDASSTDSATTQ